MTTLKSNIEFAREARLIPITEVAKQIGLRPDDLIQYGETKAKIKMATVRRIFSENRPKGRLVLVSAITPTPAGEGKTTVSVGLAQALKVLGKNAIVALREPSLGPCMGMKGGATGGGYAQVVPMEDINLHFTGDLHAVTSAHNLIAAALDNHLHFGNTQKLSLHNILWKRVMDMNDRALRDIVIGLGGKKNGVPRQTGFDITAASEVMAILCLSLSYSELREKLGNILLGFKDDGEPFLLKELNVQGAAAALLKEALQPNLVQTMENGPAFVHGGPFANIAQGANSIMATKLALHLSDYVITEAGFGFDLGAEKFFDIVCPYGKFTPSALVLVATVRALKMHGGVAKEELETPNPRAVWDGRENLEKHIENAKKFGLEPLVAVNRFVHDTDEELKAVLEICRQSQTETAVADGWARGGRGGTELAEKLLVMFETNTSAYHPLYNWDSPVEGKIEKVTKEIYGAAAVEYLPKAQANLKTIYRCGYDRLPVCMAKTQNSLSDNPNLLGRPRDFTLTVREIIVSAGAGFLVPLTGEMMRMPGLPRKPAAELIDISDNGSITGLF